MAGESRVILRKFSVPQNMTVVQEIGVMDSHAVAGFTWKIPVSQEAPHISSRVVLPCQLAR